MNITLDNKLGVIFLKPAATTTTGASIGSLHDKWKSCGALTDEECLILLSWLWNVREYMFRMHEGFASICLGMEYESMQSICLARNLIKLP